MTKTQLN